MQKPQKKTIFFFSIAAILFSFLLLTSEVIYSYYNYPGRLAFPLAILAEENIKRGNLESATAQLDKMAYLSIRQNHIFYPYLIDETHPETSVSGLDNTSKKSFSHLLRTDIGYLKNFNYHPRLANIYYHLGLIAYKAGFETEAQTFFKTATLISPTLSYLHIELAEAYFAERKYQEGSQAINFCLQFEEAAKHCSEYQNANVTNNTFLGVGYFENLIDKHQR